MKEKGALFGAEASGHIMFADRYYGYDDGIYAALRFLELFSKSNKTLDQMRAELPKAYNTPEFKIKVPDERKFVLIEEIKEEIKSIGKRFNDTDGLRVQTEHGWWLLRASNTEGAISGRCEATSSEGLEILKNELEKILSVYGFNLRFE
jgi:phosphomannomutase